MVKVTPAVTVQIDTESEGPACPHLPPAAAGPAPAGESLAGGFRALGPSEVCQGPGRHRDAAAVMMWLSPGRTGPRQSR